MVPPCCLSPKNQVYINSRKQLRDLHNSVPTFALVQNKCSKEYSKLKSSRRKPSSLHVRCLSSLCSISSHHQCTLSLNSLLLWLFWVVHQTELRSSLSDVLNPFYPLAGRLRAPDSGNHLYVEFTDEGVVWPSCRRKWRMTSIHSSSTLPWTNLRIPCQWHTAPLTTTILDLISYQFRDHKLFAYRCWPVSPFGIWSSLKFTCSCYSNI